MLGQWLIGGSYEISVIVIGFAFLFYSSIGGMWAVTITDIIQGGMMMIGALLMAIIALGKFGGLTSLIQQSLAARPQLANLGMPVISVIGLSFIWCIWGLIAPATIMRILTMKNSASARRSLALGSVFAAVSVGFTALIVAMAASLLSPAELKNPDMAYIIAIEKFFPPVIRGFMIASIFAAIMSSTDSLLLAVSASVARDIYKNMINPSASEKTVVKIGSITIWVAGIIIIWISTKQLPLISLLAGWCAGGMISSLTAPLLCGLYWKKTNREGTFAGMVSGFIMFMVLNIFKLVPSMSELIFAVPVSAIFTYVVTLMTYKNKSDQKLATGVN